MEEQKLNMSADSGASLSFSPRAAFCVLLSLSSLLGAITLALHPARAVCVIALLVIATVIFFITRDRLPLLAIVLPAIGLVWLGAEATLPSIFIGTIFSSAATLYLLLGKKYIWVGLTAAVSYAICAIIAGPIVALPTLMPFALGGIMSLVMLRKPLTVTVGAGAVICMSAFVAVTVILCGNNSIGSVTELSDFVREQIVASLCNENNKFVIFNEMSARTIAVWVVNISPALIFVISYTLVYLCHALTVSILYSSGFAGKLPRECVRVEISPATAVFTVIAFFASMIFDAVGDGYELFLVTANNIIIALAPVLAVIGMRTAADYFKNTLFGSRSRAGVLSIVSVALLTLSIPTVTIPLAVGIGTAYSLLPIYRYLFAKIKSHIRE